MTQSTFTFTIVLPQELTLSSDSEDLGAQSIRVPRDTFFDWLWSHFGPRGLVGIHEGTLLCDEAVVAGLESTSWLVDSAQAPTDRDWVGRQERVEAVLFFSSRAEADDAMGELRKIPELMDGLEKASVSEQKPQDWDAQWKASFLNDGEGVEVAPFWRIFPPWVKSKRPENLEERQLFINPGAGFGTGTHETTQLCMEALGRISQEKKFNGVRALDFGSGSGILSIALGRLGAQVRGVEIDAMAIENAEENCSLNDLTAEQIRFSQALESSRIENGDEAPYEIIVANILKPVLLEYSELLVKQLSPQGFMILSGLIREDVDAVSERYMALLGVNTYEVLAKNEWRALVFTRPRRVRRSR